MTTPWDHHEVTNECTRARQCRERRYLVGPDQAAGTLTKHWMLQRPTFVGSPMFFGLRKRRRIGAPGHRSLFASLDLNPLASLARGWPGDVC